MANFDFKRSSRKCSHSDRQIMPGEDFFSALVDQDDVTVRMDFGVETWEANGGPPENCIGWWKSRVPDVGKGKVYWAPRDVLLAYFEHISQQPQTSDTIYVMALLLLQKRILTHVESILEEETQVLRLKDRRTKNEYRVSEVDVSPERITEIQNELGETLFSDQPFESEEDGSTATDEEEAD